MKFSLSFLVVFAYVISYLLAPRVVFDWVDVILLYVAGLGITGAANAANQLIERNTDALMLRTHSRPLVQKSLSIFQVVFFIIITLFIGLWILYVYFSVLSVVLSVISFFLYVFVYTPLKKKTSFAVFIGAIPGALPCLIGWAAATNSLVNPYGWVLFFIQFFWQFPHFWSVAWIVHADYAKAGYRLLPFGLAPGRIVAIQTMAFALLLFIVSFFPYILHKVAYQGLLGIMIANAVLLFYCLGLIKHYNESSYAKRVMFACYFYLPIVFLLLLLFKIN